MRARLSFVSCVESNRKAYSLSAAMHTLHFRVTDLNERGWREEPMSGGLDEILRPLHEFIQGMIVERRKSATKDMLSFWITEHPTLTDDELQNLCLTFLTMGQYVIQELNAPLLVIFSCIVKMSPVQSHGLLFCCLRIPPSSKRFGRRFCRSNR